jgi:hypothetical protein
MKWKFVFLNKNIVDKTKRYLISYLMSCLRDKETDLTEFEKQTKFQCWIEWMKIIKEFRIFRFWHNFPSQMYYIFFVSLNLSFIIQLSEIGINETQLKRKHKGLFFRPEKEIVFRHNLFFFNNNFIHILCFLQHSFYLCFIGIIFEDVGVRIFICLVSFLLSFNSFLRSISISKISLLFDISNQTYRFILLWINLFEVIMRNRKKPKRLESNKTTILFQLSTTSQISKQIIKQKGKKEKENLKWLFYLSKEKYSLWKRRKSEEKGKDRKNSSQSTLS